MAPNAMPGLRDDDIKKALDHVGITPNYKGYEMLVRAIGLACEDERRLCRLHNEIYAPVALHENCNMAAVERRIRTAIRASREFTPDKLMLVFGATVLDRQPSNARFIASMTRFLKENSNDDEC